MKQYEYKIETKNYFDMQKEVDRLEFLNQEGDKGWELYKDEYDDEVSWTFWFKRETLDEYQP